MLTPTPNQLRKSFANPASFLVAHVRTLSSSSSGAGLLLLSQQLARISAINVSATSPIPAQYWFVLLFFGLRCLLLPALVFGLLLILLLAETAPILVASP